MSSSIVDPDSWDAGYSQGYSAGYSWAVEEVVGWLADNGHADASEALRYLLSPEGVYEMNERLKATYESLAKLAAEARVAS
jgi:hypothetical protein